MATTPSTHSPTSSVSSSRSSSPTYRLFPHAPQPSSRPRHISLLQINFQQQQQQQQQQHISIQPTQSTSTSTHQRNFSRPHYHRRHTTISKIQPPTTSTTTTTGTHSHLTNSIERATLPMLAHLNQQLNLTRFEPERDRVRRQIHRQETVMTLSGLLKDWGEKEERSWWSDDSDDESEGNDEEWEV
ncbi:hypothetical protein GJ744_007405 [Endocarpon pusillum]|uniref:Uncharacterized protein n=1 Tax=Endocarpon pusillum TaxID=364733 RepID=A0A8H7AKN0_9EURO|nr:hypothetical protein GJ744_007405 [Endocarpon pusillum]